MVSFISSQNTWHRIQLYNIRHDTKNGNKVSKSIKGHYDIKTTLLYFVIYRDLFSNQYSTFIFHQYNKTSSKYKVVSMERFKYIIFKKIKTLFILMGKKQQQNTD